MVLGKFSKSGSFAALAAGLALMTIPVAANAEPGDSRNGRWENRGGNNGGDRRWRGNDDDRNRADGPRADGNRGDQNRDEWRGRPQQSWNGQNRNGPNWNGQNWNRGNDRGGNWSHGGNWDRNRGNNWNRDWRRDNRYNWSYWRDHNRNQFRVGRYHPPYRDWSYRRLSIGFFLDSGFYGGSYLIDDPWAYRLPPAYGPYRWVRYYDDAMLVDIYSGEVVDTIYDFFW